MRIKDTENCPCGSEKLYKQCCKNRKDQKVDLKKLVENENRMNAEAISVLRNSKFSTCLHPSKNECSKKIIGAHTLQNNGVLSYLSYNEEVVVIEPGVNKNGVKLDFKNKTKKKATTFTGFCSYHDREVFKPIETVEYLMESDEQNFLFAYRIFAHEYYKKHVAFKVFQKTIRKFPSRLNEEMFIGQYRNYQLAIKDMEEYTRIFNSALLSKNYSVLSTHVVEFDFRLPFATCFAYSPYYDFNKEPINLSHMFDFNEDRLKLNFVTVLPQEKKSYILYSWLKEDDSHFHSIKSSLESFDNKDIKRTFNNLIPEYSEHVVFAPKYWQRLSDMQKEAFSNRMLGDFASFSNEAVFMPDVLENKSSLSKRPIYNLFRDFSE